MTNDFKAVLEVRTENLREGRSRQEKFTQACYLQVHKIDGLNQPTPLSQGVTPTNLPNAALGGFHKGSVLAMSAMDDENAYQVGGLDSLIKYTCQKKK